MLAVTLLVLFSDATNVGANYIWPAIKNIHLNSPWIFGASTISLWIVFGGLTRHGKLSSARNYGPQRLVRAVSRVRQSAISSSTTMRQQLNLNSTNKQRKMS